MTTATPDNLGPANVWIRSLAPLVGVIAIALALHGVSLAPFVGSFGAKLMVDCGIAIIAAVSLTIVNGFTGQFSIGHAAFVAIGSYASGLITYYTLLRHIEPAAIRDVQSSLVGGHQFLLAFSCLVGGCVAALAGWLVGLPSLRLKGDYLAIVTLGFGEIVRLMLQLTPKKVESSEELREIFETGTWLPHGATATKEATKVWWRFLAPPGVDGSLGFTDLPKVTNVFWTFLFVGLTIVIAYRVKVSSYGRALLSIREDEIAAEAMGINTARLKIRAFVLAAFLAGIAGGLYAHVSGNNPTPSDAGFQRSFEIVMMVVLGGLGSISGSMLASILIVAAGEWLRAPTHVWHVGLALILCRAILGVYDVAFPRVATLRACLTLAGVVAAVEAIRALAIVAAINLGDYRMVLFALMLILMMIFRPQGLFGLREVWDVFTQRRDEGRSGVRRKRC